MKAKYIIAVLIAIYGIGSLVVMMNLESKIRQKQIIIISQQKTIEYLTVKYLGTPEEQKLVKEANKLLRDEIDKVKEENKLIMERNNAK